MESLARLLIGFVLIYQLSPMADCKVIKQRDEHETEIKETEVNYERSNTTTHFNATLERGPQVEFTETSIKYTNSTPSSSGSSINSLTHMWVAESFSLILFYSRDARNLSWRFLRDPISSREEIKRKSSNSTLEGESVSYRSGSTLNDCFLNPLQSMQRFRSVSHQNVISSNEQLQVLQC